jgi:hypothetical protein
VKVKAIRFQLFQKKGSKPRSQKCIRAEALRGMTVQLGCIETRSGDICAVTRVNADAKELDKTGGAINRTFFARIRPGAIVNVRLHMRLMPVLVSK